MAKEHTITLPHNEFFIQSLIIQLLIHKFPGFRNDIKGFLFREKLCYLKLQMFDRQHCCNYASKGLCLEFAQAESLWSGIKYGCCDDSHNTMP